MGKPRKIRQIPPLGRKAVLLQSLKDNGGLDMNSDRLLESKDAKKGFRNVFREYNINDDDDADDGDVEDPEDTVAEDEEDDGNLSHSLSLSFSLLIYICVCVLYCH